MRILCFSLLLTACAAGAPNVRVATAPEEAPAIPSGGCRAPEDVKQGDRLLTSGGHTRRFRLVVPQSALGHPAPLVLNMHGLMETAEMQQMYTRMDEKAAQRGMIVAYPQGLGNSWNAGECCGRAKDEHIDDVRYLRDLVRELSEELCIDRARVYATGMSNGAIMSYRLACEASDVFAAIAPVAGVEAVPKCEPKRPVPVLAFNGTSDLLVHWDGSWFGLPSAKDTGARWRARNQCSAQVATLYRQGDALCEEPRGCAAETVQCRIDGGGHTWPGGLTMFFLGHTSSDVDASASMLDFFLAHPLATGYGLRATGLAQAQSASMRQ